MSLRPNLGLNGFCTCIQSGLPTGQFASKLPVKESTEHTYDAVSESNDAMDGPEHAGIKERPVSSDSSGKSVILHFFFFIRCRQSYSNFFVFFRVLMITRVVYFGDIRVKVKVSTCFRRNELLLGVKVRLGGQV